jgi:hypothetical protein
VDRRTVVVRDGDGYADPTVREETYVDGDSNGVEDRKPSLKERLTGRPDGNGATVQDQDVPDAGRRRP